MSDFRIDILDAANARLGDGSLTTVTWLTDTRRLDRTGTVRFEMLAADPRAAYITAGCKFDIYDRVDHYLGRYLYASKTLSGSGDTATLRVQAWDQLRELSFLTTGFFRDYDDATYRDMATELLSIAQGWFLSMESGLGSDTLSFSGESVLKAIGLIIERAGAHYRLGDNAGELQIGSFGNQSAVRLVNLSGQEQSVISAHPEIAIIDNLQRVEDIDEIANSIVPLGAGDGVAQLTIEGATAGTYTVLTGINADGSLYYYIENTASVATYGRRQKVIIFNEIRPIANNTTAKANAANALKIAAESWIQYHLEPRIEYTCIVRALRQTVHVGDMIRLVYKGVVDGYGYIDVDDWFYVMEVTRQRDASGQRTALLGLSSVQIQRVSDVDLVSEVVSNLQSIKTHIKPVPFWTTDRQWDTIGNVSGGVSKSAVFDLEIDDSVLQATIIRIRFVTVPLYAFNSPVNNATWQNKYYYESNQDSHYPAGLSLVINGVDRTVAYGGPWNASPTDAAVDVELDITDDIVGAVGGMYQRHSIVFTCTARPNTPIEVAGWTAIAANASQGIVQLRTKIQGVAQGILPA